MNPARLDFAFSMIELMVAISVLSIGIILIARSFLSASSALSSCESRIVALSFLEGKMAEVEEMTLNGEENLAGPNASVLINGRNAEFKSDLQVMKIGKDEDGLFINKVMLNVSWREANRSYDEDLGTYVEIKKKK